MRKQRVAMVQNVVGFIIDVKRCGYASTACHQFQLQYRILHKGVLELLQRKLSEENHVYENVTPVLI